MRYVIRPVPAGPVDLAEQLRVIDRDLPDLPIGYGVGTIT